jgi:hypothetical protein
VSGQSSIRTFPTRAPPPALRATSL